MQHFSQNDIRNTFPSQSHFQIASKYFKCIDLACAKQINLRGKLIINAELKPQPKNRICVRLYLTLDARIIVEFTLQ